MPHHPFVPVRTDNAPDTGVDDDARYLALRARDARFDGHFFAGVTSTGIYCRPVCRVRAPKRENCRFFDLAAQAEAAGFRPCMRCRPELAPHSTASTPAWSAHDASGLLARQAAQLLDDPAPWSTGSPRMEDVASRLGVSPRHLRRIFENTWGISPLQYWQTQRLLSAKQLLTDTRLPVAQVAYLSGYASVRRFNAVFAQHYRMPPGALRRHSGGGHSPSETATAPACITCKAAYRPPYDTAAMLGFFAARQIDGLELVDPTLGTLARTCTVPAGETVLHGWVRARFDPSHHTVALDISESLAAALPQVLLRLRGLLDLDADPAAIHHTLGDSFPGTEGLRLPGTLDGFELAVRAILGQQITVRAARTLAQRLVLQWGQRIPTPLPGLTHLFPTPVALAQATPDALGAIGIVRQRQRAIQALAQAVAAGHIVLQPGVDVAATMAALQALPGIGPWTAHYVAMRALRWPDAFPSGDVALHKALHVQDSQRPAEAAERASQAWRPWRSYAVIRAWSRLAQA